MNSSNTFGILGRLLNKKKIPFVLVGGFAVNFYKYSRSTKDIDFMVLVHDFEKILPDLKALGYTINSRQEMYARLVNKSPDRMPIDFLFVDEESMEEIVDNGKKVELFGEEFVFPSLDHLLAMKFHAIKQSPEFRELKDLLDIATLVDINNVDVHSKKFEDLCLKYGTKKILLNLRMFFEKNKKR